jgi:hypothetical protein
MYTRDALGRYLRAARWVPLAIRPFLAFKRVLYAGLPLQEENEHPELKAEYSIFSVFFHV